MRDIFQLIRLEFVHNRLRSRISYYTLPASDIDAMTLFTWHTKSLERAGFHSMIGNYSNKP